ncbi:Uncharacterised protein [Candidatus Venteria ishoeyi]|uniref:Lysozyme inhibitor LprI-like N-terminal domain-containing protein n=1 Tax=Candidatus Venteria ishoeyi TaxID=1899563 RepID=A0A1H6FBQ8_9GAMM|nr:Uncharacterised protein [Candidatus Venteria ishoeyi]
MQCLRTLTANRVKEWQNTYLQKPLPQAKTAPDYASADRQLNQTYRHIMGSLHKHDKKQLRTSQRLWLPFRDENCLAQQSYGVSQQQCLARMTVHRTQALQHYYQGNFHGLTAQSLIGEWRGLGGEAVMRLQFGISKGIHYYLSHLENLPFEAGQWQFNRGQLNIIASNGKLMHRYEKVALENGVLSLYEKMVLYYNIKSNPNPNVSSIAEVS